MIKTKKSAQNRPTARVQLTTMKMRERDLSFNKQLIPQCECGCSGCAHCGAVIVLTRRLHKAPHPHFRLFQPLRPTLCARNNHNGLSNYDAFKSRRLQVVQPPSNNYPMTWRRAAEGLICYWNEIRKEWRWSYWFLSMLVIIFDLSTTTGWLKITGWR